MSENSTGASMICVLTTIQSPTPSVRRLGEALSRLGARSVVVGDRKGPTQFEQPGFEFYSLSRQRELPYQLAKLLPEGHYARKNLGYLLAFAAGAECIYETDDDNAPNETFKQRTVDTPAQPMAARPWANVYRVFSNELIWPRGFPLDRVTDQTSWAHDRGAASERVHAPIQQGLADGSPDVDAVWRLTLDRDLTFDRGQSLVLPRGTWCPFNSQSTWWWPEAYALMYLPSFCSFRMTDIWRSFIAQRCLWELGYGLVFHAAEVVQERNPHNLMRDFQDEIAGYTGNDRLTKTLMNLDLAPGTAGVTVNLRQCYAALSAEGFFPADELKLLDAWLADFADTGL